MSQAVKKIILENKVRAALKKPVYMTMSTDEHSAIMLAQQIAGGKSFRGVGMSFRFKTGEEEKKE